MNTYYQINVYALNLAPCEPIKLDSLKEVKKKVLELRKSHYQGGVVFFNGTTYQHILSFNPIF